MFKKLRNLVKTSEDGYRTSYSWGDYTVTEIKRDGMHSISIRQENGQMPPRMEDMVQIIGHLGLKGTVKYKQRLQPYTLHCFYQKSTPPLAVV